MRFQTFRQGSQATEQAAASIGRVATATAGVAVASDKTTAATLSMERQIQKLQMSLDGVEGKQRSALNVLEESYDSRMRRMRGVFSDLGLDMAEMEKATPKSGIGGPYVPVKPASADAFDRQQRPEDLLLEHW